MSSARDATIHRRQVLCLALASSVGTSAVGSAAADEALPQHEHPDEVDEDGSLGTLHQGLAEYLEASLGESIAALEGGDYDLAEAYVGEEYDDRLEQFWEVSRLQEEDDDPELEEEEDGEGEVGAEPDLTWELERIAFRNARDDQRTFIEANRAYEETYAEYQDASGDEQRELARELDEYHEIVQRSGSDLEDAYAVLSSDVEEVDVDLEEEQEVVRRIREDVATRQEQVLDEALVETTLTLDTRSAQASFLDPLVVEGELQSAEATPTPGEATFEIEDRELTTSIETNGTFTFEYRPITTPLDAEELTVEYVPSSDSEYQASRATVPIEIEQVDPSIDVTDSPSEAALGDEITVAGSVTVDGIGADAVPVAVAIGGEHVGQTITDEDGSYELTTTLPAGVPSGGASLNARVAMSDRALAPADVNLIGATTIAETASDLTVNAEPQVDNTIAVDGRLATTDDEGVAGQAIEFRVDGSTVGALETADDGNYEGVLPTAHIDGTGEPREIEVVAVYEGGGNVHEAQASTAIEMVIEDTDEAAGVGETIVGTLLQLVGGDADSIGSDLGDPSSFGLVHWFVLLGLAGLPIGGYLLGRRLGLIADGPRSVGSEPPVGSIAGTGDAALDVARDHLLSGEPKRAIEVAYVAARGTLSDRVDGTARTHREFYQLCRSDGFTREELTALETLTDHYERAAFAPSTISTNDAERAIDAAARFVAEPATD